MRNDFRKHNPQQHNHPMPTTIKNMDPEEKELKQIFMCQYMGQKIFMSSQDATEPTNVSMFLNHFMANGYLLLKDPEYMLKEDIIELRKRMPIMYDEDFGWFSKIPDNEQLSCGYVYERIYTLLPQRPGPYMMGSIVSFFIERGYAMNWRDYNPMDQVRKGWCQLTKPV